MVQLDLLRLDSALRGVRRLWESPAIRRVFYKRLGRPVDISAIRTLLAIDRGPDECCVTDVAALLVIDNSTASRMVDALVVDGLAARQPFAHDRRKSLLTLTESGVELLDAANLVRAQLLAEMTEGWVHEDLETLSSLLDRFAVAITKFEEPA